MLIFLGDDMPKAHGIETIDARSRLPAHELSEQLTQLLTETRPEEQIERSPTHPQIRRIVQSA